MPPGAEAERVAEQFYRDVLGMRRVDRGRRESGRTLAARGGCWFKNTSVRLHLGVEEDFVPARKAHPAFFVDDLDAVSKRVVNAGGEVRPSDEIPGVHRAHTDDPFGNRIELVELQGPLTPEMYAVVLNYLIYPVVLIDADGLIRWAGGSMERFFGYAAGELAGRRFDELLAPESVLPALEAFASIDDAYEVTPWGGVGVQVDVLHADGHPVNCECAAITTRRTGLPWYVVLIRQAGYERALDQAIEAMAASRPLGEVLALLVSAVEHMVPETGVAVCDHWTSDHFEVSAGRAATLLTAQPGSPWSRALASAQDVIVEDRSGLPGPLAALARAEGYEACWVHPVSLSDGEDPVAAIIVWRRITGPPTRFTWNAMHKAGQLLRLTLQWDRSQQDLQYAATHDQLTGLHNRKAFRERLEQVTKSGEGQAAVLFLDLDRFKPVNDQLGHQAGDRVLAVVAERLVAALRPGDLVARLGGDEFAVLCERMERPELIDRVANRLLEVIRQPIPTPSGQTAQIGVSIGVADVRGFDQVDTVLARADEAMRQAKRAGRGRWLRWLPTP